MKKPTTRFRDLDATQLLQFAEEICHKIGEHRTLFVTPTPDLSTLSAATAVFRDAVTEAAFRDRRAISFRNDQRKELETVISDLAKYVDIVARGNETIILSAGFQPTKDRRPGSRFNPKAEKLEAAPRGLGTSQVRVKVAPWEKARYYQFEYRKKEAGAEWNRLLSSRSVAYIGNLDPFQEYEFRVTYLGKDTTPNYSDVVATYAL